jgi:hypothetical protein
VTGDASSARLRVNVHNFCCLMLCVYHRTCQPVQWFRRNALALAASRVQPEHASEALGVGCATGCLSLPSLITVNLSILPVPQGLLAGSSRVHGKKRPAGREEGLVKALAMKDARERLICH